MNDEMQMDALAKANAANIVKKVKAGGVLTAAQQRTLDEFRSAKTGGQWVKDTSTLAKELGLSRQAIYDARARFPDSPRKHDDGRRENLAAWQLFCANNIIGKDKATRNLADLKAELMREQIELARMKNAEAKREVIDRNEVRDYLHAWLAKLDLVLVAELLNNVPNLVSGLTISETRVEMRKTLDRIRESTHRGLRAYEDDHPVFKAEFLNDGNEIDPNLVS